MIEPSIEEQLQKIVDDYNLITITVTTSTESKSYTLLWDDAKLARFISGVLEI